MKSVKSDAPKLDVYTRVTNKIIADLEKGELTWMKPWSGDNAAGRIVRPLRGNGIPYQGINVILLWASAIDQGFNSATWMTFKQALELGACVRKGEHGSMVVYADAIQKTQQDDKTGEDVEVSIPFMKSYTVFNVEQIDGLPERFRAQPETPVIPEEQRNAELDQFFKNLGVTIHEMGNKASYSVALDLIKMPPFVTFRDAESFYATLAHESAHSTRHSTRLNRDFGRKQWGDTGYAREELCAEISSAILCADLSITPETREDHAAYIQNWLQVLKGDKRFIFTAAAHAQRAVDWMHKQQPQAQTETPEIIHAAA
jgi:antirestriction protein ArdC